MIRHFWIAFAVTVALAISALGAIGWLAAKFFAPPPPERFVSSTFEFDLPKGWKCEREGGETVCRAGEAPHSAICILAMKYRGPDDTLDAYTARLSNPMETKDKDDNPLRSEVKRVERRSIAGFTWVHGVHYQSELAAFFTDYYATVTSHIAILVTFSAHQDHLERYRKEFDVMTSSLKVYQRDFR